MGTVAIIYHSGFGHTARVAEYVADGCRLGGADPTLLTVHAATDELESLARYDALVFGAPTYMGSCSAAFKGFMEATVKIWLNRGWKDKLAAGFSNSGGLHGDKQNTLVQLATFAAQHGMIWISQGEMAEQVDGRHGGQPDAINRVGASLGLMTQSDNAAPDLAPPRGDLETARLFGQRIAQVCARVSVPGNGKE